MGRPLIPIFCKPVTVEDGVWVAAKAMICRGSVLARMSVVAVGVVWRGTTAAAGVQTGPLRPDAPLRRSA